MRTTAWRRIVNLGVICAIAAVGVSYLPVAAATSTGGVLYGIGFPATLESIDGASGTQTPITQLTSIGPNALVLATAADQGGLSVFALVGTCTVCPGPRGGGPVFWHIAQVNPQSGSFQASPILERPLAQSIAADPATHHVWSVTDCFVCASQAVVNVDPASGAETDAATLPVPSFFDTLVALAPSMHTLYVAVSVTSNSQLFIVDTATSALRQGPSIGAPVAGLAVDTSNGGLFALTGFSPQRLVRIDPTTGQQTVLASIGTVGAPLAYPTIDPSSHTLFAVGTGLLGGNEREIVSINDQTGAVSVGAGINNIVRALAFQPAPITPESIKADVENSLSSGAIDNVGVANSLLAKLDAAEDARSRGECGTAADAYRAFVNELTAQSGHHIALATASQLISEAKFLIANCP